MQNNYTNPPRTTRAGVRMPGQRPPRSRRVQRKPKQIQRQRPQRSRVIVERAASSNYAEKIIPARMRSYYNSEYLNTLVDPENCRGYRYPDELPKATAVVRSLINKDVFVFPDDTYEPAGTYYNVLSPTMIDPLLQLEIDNLDSSEDLMGGVTRPDDEVGLYPVVEDSGTAATTSDQMWAAPNVPVNLKTQWHWTSQTFSYPGFRGKATDGTTFYGVPVVVSSATGNFRVRITYNSPATVTTPRGTLTAVSATGSIAMVPDAVAVGAMTQGYSLTGAAIASSSLGKAVAGGTYIPLPGVAFRFQSNDTEALLISAFVINLHPSDAAAVDQVRLVGVKTPSEATFCSTVEQYRVVSMSNWIEYDGSTLKDGGQVAATLFRAGQSAMEAGLWNYDSVAVAPEALASKLKDGTYTIWCPNSTEDMVPRALNSANRWKLPYIVNAGLVSEPDQIRSLRMRIPINYEIISTDQIYDYAKPSPDPRAIELASRILRVYPTSVPNGMHLGWIRDILKKAKETAKGVTNWAFDNRDWLIPAVEAAASFL